MVEIKDSHFRDEWIPALESVMSDWQKSWGDLPYRLPLKDSTGLECWRVYYDDCLTAEQAFWADQENWSA